MKLMKIIVRKVDKKGSLNSMYVHFDRCREEVCLIPGQGCIQCIIKGGREGIIDLTGPYRYCETCDDIKCHISEVDTRGHKDMA